MAEKVAEDDIEALKDKDLLSEMMEELSREIPNAKQVLIDERDEYIAKKILSAKGNKIVAVVGAGHVDGILKRLNETEKKKETTHLEAIPPSPAIMKIIGYSIPLLVISIIVAGFFRSGAGLSMQMIKYWVLINGTLPAIAAALALAHPLTILTAFVVAPITSLNPFLAAGWFAGLMEARMREPRVEDFEALKDIEGVTDFWRNKITRILLVSAFANLASSIGTFVGIPYLMSLL